MHATHHDGWTHDVHGIHACNARTDGVEVALGNLACAVPVKVLEDLLHLGLLNIKPQRPQRNLP